LTASRIIQLITASSTYPFLLLETATSCCEKNLNIVPLSFFTLNMCFFLGLNTVFFFCNNLPTNLC